MESIEEIELENYVVVAVAGEMPSSFNEEALKAGAIAVRTYVLRRIRLGEKITDNVSTQTYIEITDMQEKWVNELKIDIIEFNESGRVEKVLIGNQVYTGLEIRNMLGLSLTDLILVLYC